MYANSNPVLSSQNDVHKDLVKTVRKHFSSNYQKPVSENSFKIFKAIEELKTSINLPAILDSGCGTGESTQVLAQQNPDRLIIGIDKSLHRLSRSNVKETILQEENMILVRMNLVDFWLLAKQHEWQIEKHYLFYPNPWPKPKHLQRRWHAHPIFPVLLSLGGEVELRSNWQIYAEEFSCALNETGKYKSEVNTLRVKIPRSPFEKKYLDSGHTLYQVTTRPKT